MESVKVCRSDFDCPRESLSSATSGKRGSKWPHVSGTLLFQRRESKNHRVVSKKICFEQLKGPPFCGRERRGRGWSEAGGTKQTPKVCARGPTRRNLQRQVVGCFRSVAFQEAQAAQVSLCLGKEMVLPEMSGLGEVHHSRGQLHALPNKNDFQEVICRKLAAHNPDARSAHPRDAVPPSPPLLCVFNPLQQQEGRPALSSISRRCSRSCFFLQWARRLTIH